MEGIAKAKAAGVYKGHPASIDPAQVRQLKAEGWGTLSDRPEARHRPRIRLSGPGGLMFTPGTPDLAALLPPGISTDPLRCNRGIETFGRRPSPASTAWVCCTRDSEEAEGF